MRAPISRRHLFAAAAALPASAQQTALPPASDEAKLVQSLLRSAFEQMRKAPLPRSTEPATHFKP